MASKIARSQITQLLFLGPSKKYGFARTSGTMLERNCFKK